MVIGFSGRAQVPLLGGFLTLLATTAGTRHRPDLGKAILLIEDVSEVPNRIDRSLVELEQPATTPVHRCAVLRNPMPPAWGNVTVTAWSGLTAAYCHEPWAGVIVRGVRNHTDLRQEWQLAAMNEELGITTLLIPGRPALASTSSTAIRALRG